MTPAMGADDRDFGIESRARCSAAVVDSRRPTIALDFAAQQAFFSCLPRDIGFVAVVAGGTQQSYLHPRPGYGPDAHPRCRSSAQHQHGNRTVS